MWSSSQKDINMDRPCSFIEHRCSSKQMQPARPPRRKPWTRSSPLRCAGSRSPLSVYFGSLLSFLVVLGSSRVICLCFVGYHGFWMFLEWMVILSFEDKIHGVPECAGLELGKFWELFAIVGQLEKWPIPVDSFFFSTSLGMRGIQRWEHGCFSAETPVSLEHQRKTWCFWFSLWTSFSKLQHRGMQFET